MHELPKDLANSVRSWRASIYKEPSDVEKGDHGIKEHDYGDKDFERALSPGDSSIILHPTRSQHALKQTSQPPTPQHQLQHQPSQLQLRTQSQGQSQPQPQGNTNSNTAQSPAITRRPNGGPAPQTPASAKKSVFTAPKVDDIDLAADRLEDDLTPLTPANFYELIGMKAPISKQQNPRDLTIKHGLYGRICERLNYTNTMYRTFDILTYSLLILQLFLSAVFIVLGGLARTDTHIAVACLGAVSTVVAGALALMKGNGLPNRLRQSRDNLRNVQFEAEELYWDVGADKEVKYKDVKKLREDFLRVMEEARRNHPDTWNSFSSGVAQGIKTAPGKKPTLSPAAQPKF
ncbi:hypothetical protein LTR78_008444 [Recurvomyces mirabilis]|uniref:SMODS and SLOG-associating 2TM effector domain-containing protein n=1 Tax=Recurvomyces mirabilis TaxID=574656 RepID=A0AAE0TRF4_9PEZI|nr:hypothetical protein LTR78_008444 [Recurvomyces mirabilis]KAK5155432.1 hypothetical protein LTS14_005693 [Recurvomyces mirabilis]